MKKLITGVLAAGLLVSLVACSTKKAASADYSYVYTTDPQTMDYLYTYRAADHMYNANYIDGLTENDAYGKIIGSMAESWEHNADYTEWTYKIRKGVKWVDSTGTEVADVKAQDWVTGLQHAIDFKSGTSYLVTGSVKGLAAYAKGTDKDFSKVGVEAVDDYTLKYTLESPEPYWNSKTLYSILYPVSVDLLNSKGDGCKLGSPNPDTCTFGQVKQDSIWYNGAYILSSFASKSKIELIKNDSYWDKDNVNVNKLTWVFFDGSDVDSILRNFTSGQYSQARLYTTNEAFYAQAKKDYADNIFTSQTGTGTYNLNFNLNRQSFALSQKTAGQQADTKAAILNKNFRNAIQYAIDKSAYLAIGKGEDLKTVAIRNQFTPTTFVNVDEKPYGDAVEKELKAIDATKYANFDTAEAQNSTYNVETAKALLAAAKAELNVSWPIQLDFIQDQTSALGIAQANALKASVEASLGKENVIINVVTTDHDSYYGATYEADSPEATDYDISNASGWSPDYQDPKSYLEVFNPSTGDMLTSIGLSIDDVATAQEKAVKTQIGLYDYKAMLEAADAETSDINNRYALYAKADAWLIDNAIQIPLQTDGGNPTVTKLVPFVRQYSPVGLAEYKFKGVQIQDKTVTTAEYNTALEKFKTESAKVEQ